MYVVVPPTPMLGFEVVRVVEVRSRRMDRTFVALVEPATVAFRSGVKMAVSCSGDI